MQVTVKYFGAIAEETGIQEEELSLEKIDFELEKLKAYCVEKYYLKEADTIQLAINQTLQKAGVLKDGDEVALLPPYAGG